MKRAQTLIVGTGLAQLDCLAHHIDDIDSGQQFLDERLRDQTSMGGLSQADRRARTMVETVARSA